MNTRSCSNIFVPNNIGSAAAVQMKFLVYLYALCSLVCLHSIMGPAVPDWFFFIQEDIWSPVTGYCENRKIVQTELEFTPSVIHNTLTSALFLCVVSALLQNTTYCLQWKELQKRPFKKKSETCVFRASTQLHSILTSEVIFSFFIAVVTKET